MNVLVLGGPLHRQGIDVGENPIPHYRYPIREPGELTPSFDDCTLKTFKVFDYTLIRLFDGTPIYIPSDLVSRTQGLRFVHGLTDYWRGIAAMDFLADLTINYNKEKGFPV